jgi:hypothetical protein
VNEFEWTTTKILLSHEMEKVIAATPEREEELRKMLNGIYFEWIARVGRHIVVTKGAGD